MLQFFFFFLRKISVSNNKFFSRLHWMFQSGQLPHLGNYSSEFNLVCFPVVRTSNYYSTRALFQISPGWRDVTNFKF